MISQKQSLHPNDGVVERPLGTWLILEAREVASVDQNIAGCIGYEAGYFGGSEADPRYRARYKLQIHVDMQQESLEFHTAVLQGWVPHDGALMQR